jgi:ketosteroid isomerase-like protein
MKTVLIALSVIAIFTSSSFAQASAQKIFDTEKAFERMVAEKGINAGFIEFMSSDGIMFSPDVVNGREAWKKRAPSPALLTWNPIWIEVSSNGALAYSIGNAIYRGKGKDDTELGYNHYLSIWSRQPNGEYRAVMDTGVSHEKPASMPTEWKSPVVSGNTKLQNSAGDHAINFYAAVESAGAVKAYKSFLAEDGFILREGSTPFVGKAAIAQLDKNKSTMKFAKRKTFIEAGDIAWVSAGYTVLDKTGKEIEKGNFVQVWKLRGGKWVIAADILKPLPKPSN